MREIEQVYPALERLYGPDAPAQKGRYRLLLDSFEELFGSQGRQVRFFSAPGRSEIIGNHTDHQRGRVVAAAINLDAIAAAARRDDGWVCIQSKGYPIDRVDMSQPGPVKEEAGTSAALIRGMAAELRRRGYRAGGFDAYTTSQVLKGSGLSSSAAFEVLVGGIINGLFNDGRIPPQEIAMAAQKVENRYFGKPSGLMDQMASAVGGLVAIDFRDPGAPLIEPIDCDFSTSGYVLCVVDTGGDHTSLTASYAAITEEMKMVARQMGKDCLREVDPDELYASLGKLRRVCGDRALLRACHFVEENERAGELRDALEAGDYRAFKQLILKSGRSSFEYLQNVVSPGNAQEQGLSLALLLSERLLSGRGAWRVHGGGFAGTILAFVPEDMLDAYREEMESVFGQGSCYALRVRQAGMTELLPDET